MVLNRPTAIQIFVYEILERIANNLENSLEQMLGAILEIIISLCSSKYPDSYYSPLSMNMYTFASFYCTLKYKSMADHEHLTKKKTKLKAEYLK